jgi:hypothetical protein
MLKVRTLSNFRHLCTTCFPDAFANFARPILHQRFYGIQLMYSDVVNKMKAGILLLMLDLDSNFKCTCLQAQLNSSRNRVSVLSGRAMIGQHHYLA